MSTHDDWSIEEHPSPFPPVSRERPRPLRSAWISAWDYEYCDGPTFYGAEEIERFIEELRAASQRVFGPSKP